MEDANLDTLKGCGASTPQSPYAELIRQLDCLEAKITKVDDTNLSVLLNKIPVKIDGVNGAINHLTLKVDHLTQKVDDNQCLVRAFCLAFTRVFR